MNRVWTYARGDYNAPHRWRLRLGSDEYGRRTIVAPIPFAGYVVVAFWTCRCWFCEASRAQTAADQDALLGEAS